MADTTKPRQSPKMKLEAWRKVWEKKTSKYIVSVVEHYMLQSTTTKKAAPYGGSRPMLTPKVKIEEPDIVKSADGFKIVEKASKRRVSRVFTAMNEHPLMDTLSVMERKMAHDSIKEHENAEHVKDLKRRISGFVEGEVSVLLDENWSFTVGQKSARKAEVSVPGDSWLNTTFNSMKKMYDRLDAGRKTEGHIRPEDVTVAEAIRTWLEENEQEGEEEIDSSGENEEDNEEAVSDEEGVAQEMDD